MMKKNEKISLWIEVERCASPLEKSYYQSIYYETDNLSATVATALRDINENDFVDKNGEIVSPIEWQCSCLQKKCGACAMGINGVPSLACDAFLRKFKKKVQLSPLHKFPLIKDLVVDRSVLFDNLKTMNVWVKNDALIEQVDRELVYESSKCLQCGCCLEVCPNFSCKEMFFGASAFVPTSGILASLSKSERTEVLEKYEKHIYSGCAKSLSCKDICPVGIDMERMLIHSNKLSIFKQKKCKGEK